MLALLLVCASLLLAVLGMPELFTVPAEPEPAPAELAATPEPTPTPDATPTPEPSPTPEITPSPEPTEIPTASPSPVPETPVPTATPAPAAAAPLSRRAVLGVFAGLVALALLLGALSLKVRGGAHSAHRHR